MLILSPGWWGFHFPFFTYRAQCVLGPGCTVFIFLFLHDGHVDLMNTRRDVKPASLAFIQIHSLMFYIQQHCVLVMICFETFLHPILQFALPWGLILQYVSILITAPDFTEMFLFDERESNLNNDTLIRREVSLFSLKSKACLSWWSPLLRRLSPVFEAWSSLATHPSRQKASQLQGLKQHLSFNQKLPSREAAVPFFFIF